MVASRFSGTWPLACSCRPSPACICTSTCTTCSLQLRTGIDVGRRQSARSAIARRSPRPLTFRLTQRHARGSRSARHRHRPGLRLCRSGHSARSMRRREVAQQGARSSSVGVTRPLACNTASPMPSRNWLEHDTIAKATSGSVPAAAASARGNRRAARSAATRAARHCTSPKCPAAAPVSAGLQRSPGRAVLQAARAGPRSSAVSFASMPLRRACALNCSASTGRMLGSAMSPRSCSSCSCCAGTPASCASMVTCARLWPGAAIEQRRWRPGCPGAPARAGGPGPPAARHAAPAGPPDPRPWLSMRSAPPTRALFHSPRSISRRQRAVGVALDAGGELHRRLIQRAGELDATIGLLRQITRTQTQPQRARRRAMRRQLAADIGSQRQPRHGALQLPLAVELPGQRRRQRRQIRQREFEVQRQLAAVTSPPCSDAAFLMPRAVSARSRNCRRLNSQRGAEPGARSQQMPPAAARRRPRRCSPFSIDPARTARWCSAAPAARRGR